MINYEQVIADTKLELEQLIKQRKAIDVRVGQLSQILRGLSSILPAKQQIELNKELKDIKYKRSGMTDVITDLLKANPDTGFTTNDIKAALEKAGFNMLEYSQPLATIANTLARMKRRGRVKCTSVKGVGQTFTWTLRKSHESSR